MALPEHIYGILGMPLGHSLSPALHSWGYQASGHAGAFFRWEKGPEQLPAFFAAVRALPVRGLCVTIPYKQAVIPFLDELTDEARFVGAVNTILWQDGVLTGTNTDLAGFIAPLCALPDAPLSAPLGTPLTSRHRALPQTALVLGAGGAACAVLAGLARLGLRDVYLCARSVGKAHDLAGRFPGVTVLPWEERAEALARFSPLLLVNTTPLGMAGAGQNSSPLPKGALARLASAADPAASLVYDIVYNPVETVLLAEARKYGLPCQDGVDFFAAQGLEQFRLWSGISLCAGDARQVLLNLLRPGAAREAGL